MDGIYLYCILNGKHGSTSVPPSAMAEGSRVELLRIDGISVSASRVENFDMDVGQEELLWRLAAHQKVIEHFLAKETVLPVKFGTVLGSRDEVLAMLQRSEPELSEGLTRYSGTVELDVVVTWADMKNVFAELSEHPEIRAMKEGLSLVDPEARTEATVQVGRRVKDLLDEKAEKMSSAILSALRPEARDVAPNELRDDSMLLNTGFLVVRKDADRFAETVEELSQGYEGELDFRLVGPLPPYSFATVQVNRPPGTGTLLRALDTLGLPPVASLRDIRNARRRLGRALHPDHNPGNPEAQRLFEEANRAYRILEEQLVNLPHRFEGDSMQLAPMAELKPLDALRSELRP